jgi:molybdenum cofactor biosynthesis enzyme MoaA
MLGIRKRLKGRVGAILGNLMGTEEPAISISHGSGQMKAQSISIQVSDRVRCNAGCQTCISRTTPGADKCGKEIKTCDLDRLEVGLAYAKRLGATHAILTGKADPTQEDEEYLKEVIRLARKYVPLVDMHTNGYLLLDGKPKADMLRRLKRAGLTMITLSIAHHDNEKNREFMKIKQSGADLIRKARALGLMVRVSVMVHKQGVRDTESLMDYIRELGNLGAQMVVVREVWIPNVYSDINREVYDWNVANKLDIAPIQNEFREHAKMRDNAYGIREGDPLPWGTPVFLVGGIFDDPNHGVNVTFARCDEANSGTVMKSIVHKPDGHGYRNWDHNGDILY